MQNVIFIQAQTLAELAALSLNPNFICQVAEDGGIYRGDPEGGAPIKAFDAINPPPVAGSVRYVSGTDDLLETDFIVELSGTFTFSLFSADGISGGKIYYLNNSGAGTITVSPLSPETIQGGSSYSLLAGHSICIAINASLTSWLILSAS